MHREVVVPAAEIHLVAEEELVLLDEPLPDRLLPANLTADCPDVAHRQADAAKHHRADRPSVGHEPIVVGDVVLEDELADLAVVPVEGADAGADVGRDAAAADRQEAHGRGQRHDPQLQILDDLAAVVADLLRVHARHGPLIEARAEARLEVIADADEPFAAEGRRR